MKVIYQICGKISLLCYIFILYQIWHLCQFGGIRAHFMVLLPSGAVFLASFALWLISRKYRKKEDDNTPMKRKILWAEGIVVSIATAYLIGQIIYTGIPYNGALSWKIDQRLNQKEVTLEHDNFFENGVEGVLADLDEALDMPEELYIVNQYQMTFDETGKIKTIYTFLYGQDENGKTNTYLIDYDESSGPNITVRINGNATTDYEEDKRLEPMLTILQKAPCEEAVKTWAQADIGEEFEILYMGRRSFNSASGLEYLSGDVDGDGTETGTSSFGQLYEGGEIGVTEGLVFFDENFGFAGLTGASQSYSRLYMTRDGGATFTQVQLPMDSVTELPESGREAGFTVNDYDYLSMPEEQDGSLTILAVTGAGEQEEILFQSTDQGETWSYGGVSTAAS